jgi:uncharacterized protein
VTAAFAAAMKHDQVLTFAKGVRSGRRQEACMQGARPSLETDTRFPVGRQLWRDLLFVHQLVPAGLLRAALPLGLELDTYEGNAWVTLIPFAVFDSRPIGAPRALGMNFLEVNLRTYVRGPDGERGIYFFSLEASSWLAVAGARFAYALPYFPAKIERRQETDTGRIHYRSERVVAGRGAGLEATWRAEGPLAQVTPGSLDHFLIERYILFAARGGQLRRARVRHHPYPVQRAVIGSWRESLSARAGLPGLRTPAAVHFSPGVDVEIFWRHPLSR